jgi:Tol biopolymer transport system component
MNRMKGATMRYKIGIASGMLALGLGLVWAADQAREQKYQQAVDLFESKGDVKGAIRLFEEVSKSPDRNLAARVLLYLGSCYERLGPDEARKAYERVVRDFTDQPEVLAKARVRLAAMSGKQQENGVIARRIWSGFDKERWYYAVSPDGRYAVFTVEIKTAARTHKGGALYAHDLLSGAVRKIVDIDPLSRFDGAVISPDGTQIAYTTETATARRVHIARADGSNARILFGTDGVYCDIWGGWSPDGKQLIGNVSSPGKGMKAAWFSVADGSYKEIGTAFVQCRLMLAMSWATGGKALSSSHWMGGGRSRWWRVVVP